MTAIKLTLRIAAALLAIVGALAGVDTTGLLFVASGLGDGE